MPGEILFEWEGREYDHNPKDSDWYWTLGIIAVAASVAAILFANYLLALLIIIAAVSFGLHAAKVPPVHTFRLAEGGIIIGDDFHPFEKMHSFSVLEDIEGELPPMLSIKNDHWFLPHLIIPLDGVDVDLVYAHFLEKIEEAEHRHTPSDVVAAWLGF